MSFLCFAACLCGSTADEMAASHSLTHPASVPLPNTTVLRRNEKPGGKDESSKSNICFRIVLFLAAVIKIKVGRDTKARWFNVFQLAVFNFVLRAKEERASASVHRAG